MVPGRIKDATRKVSVRRTGYLTDAPFMGTTVAKVILVDFSLATRVVARGLP